MAGTLTGAVVRKQLLEPVGGIEIRLRRAFAAVLAGKDERFTETDAAGTFYFQDVPGGRWILSYREPGGVSGDVQANVMDWAITSLDIELGEPAVSELPTELLSGTWQLKELDGREYYGETKLKLSEEGRVEGRAPCNDFVARFEIRWPNLRFQSLEATEMSCPQTEEESIFFSTLRHVDHASVSPIHGLILTGPGGVLLRFEQEETRARKPPKRSQRQGNEKGSKMNEANSEIQKGAVEPDEAGSGEPSAGGSVRGHVIQGKRGQPVADATVTVVKAAGQFPDIAPLTNDEGIFGLEGLNPGEWVFRATGPDGNTGDATVIVIEKGESDFTIQIP